MHGTLWEFNRNDQLTQSYDAIADKSVTSPRLNRNQFGANIGGPVWIPKLYNGKDKTFFFFNWESGYAAQGASPEYKIVPTEAQRNGDFSGLINASTKAPIVLKDPLNIGIVGNVIPKSLLSPQTLAFLNYEPLPNTSNGVFNYLTTAASAVSRQKNFTGRVDQVLSTKDQIAGRYVFNDTYEAGHADLGPRRAQQPRPDAERLCLLDADDPPDAGQRGARRLASIQRSGSLRHHQRRRVRRGRQDGPAAGFAAA